MQKINKIEYPLLRTPGDKARWFAYQVKELYTSIYFLKG